MEAERVRYVLGTAPVFHRVARPFAARAKAGMWEKQAPKNTLEILREEASRGAIQEKRARLSGALALLGKNMMGGERLFPLSASLVEQLETAPQLQCWRAYEKALSIIGLPPAWPVPTVVTATPPCAKVAPHK